MLQYPNTPKPMLIEYDLLEHEDPGDTEYDLCGPPIMLRAGEKNWTVLWQWIPI